MNFPFLLLASISLSALAGPITPWKITKTTWSDADEKAYEKFVFAIGDSGCNGLDRCLKGLANPYRDTNLPGETFYADCADLPYMLRAYFASRNGLPFTAATEVDAYPQPWYRPIEYTVNGNFMTKRVEVLDTREGDWTDAAKFLNRLPDVTSSAMFRSPPSEDAGKGKTWPDFYPIKIDRTSVRAGTMLYDPDGHVALVYRVSDDGQVFMIDAHPGNTISHSHYGRAFSISTYVGMGHGFKQWRPIRLVGARLGTDGVYYGGHYEAARNADIADWSDEQSYGTDKSTWKNGEWPEFVVDGQTIEVPVVVNGKKVMASHARDAYYEFIQQRLIKTGFKYEPVTAIRGMADGICQDLQYRIDAVQQALDHGMDRKGHPLQLPSNIYGTGGDWELYASPSRDARLKVSFMELREKAEEFVTKFEAGDPQISYAGHSVEQLKRDLLQAYRDGSRSCLVAYKGTDKVEHSFNLEEARQRVFSMSFDPYHCIEHRWGASDVSELASCKGAVSSQDKERWYAAEQRLRNSAERTYDIRMDFTVQQLEKKVKGSGVDQAPDTDIIAYLTQ